MCTQKQTVTISYSSLYDLLNQKTGNILAEIDIPKLLAEIINKGGKVVVTYDDNKPVSELIIKEGQFRLTQHNP